VQRGAPKFGVGEEYNWIGQRITELEVKWDIRKNHNIFSAILSAQVVSFQQTTTP
jgi:hypothetical protein